MTFDAREARAKATEIYLPFTFTGYDGQDYQITHAKMIDPALTKALQSDDGDEREAAMAALAPEAWPAIQAMEPAVQVMVIEAWQVHSGLGEEGGDEPGKERPPSSAPNRAARRSKPTSRSGASTSTRSRSGKSKAASGSS